MKHCYMEVTYRKGRALAAHYYLPRLDADTSARTERAEGGFLVDFTQDDRPIGIEIQSPSRFARSRLNEVLKGLGQKPLSKDHMAPLV